jgi:hypothetical protein
MSNWLGVAGREGVGDSVEASDGVWHLSRENGTSLLELDDAGESNAQVAAQDEYSAGQGAP